MGRDVGGRVRGTGGFDPAGGGDCGGGGGGGSGGDTALRFTRCLNKVVPCAASKVRIQMLLVERQNLSG